MTHACVEPGKPSRLRRIESESLVPSKTRTARAMSWAARITALIDSICGRAGALVSPVLIFGDSICGFDHRR